MTNPASAHPGLVCVTGLPRAGSTLLCQLLGMHPEIACDGHSSPLCNSLLAMRRQISTDEFFLSQLDVPGNAAYQRLQAAMAGYLRGWLAGPAPAPGASLVVDKNRAWLHSIEMLLQLAPEARMIVCLRDLTQIAGSIEAQHQKTILLDYADGLADYDRFGRVDALFGKGRVVGDALVSLNAVNDLPGEIRQRLYFLRFEDLMADPQGTCDNLCHWLGIAPLAIDPANLPQRPHESDSHHRLKFPHARLGAIAPPMRHDIPPRIARQIHTACNWYFEAWYPDLKAR